MIVKAEIRGWRQEFDIDTKTVIDCMGMGYLQVAIPPPLQPIFQKKEIVEMQGACAYVNLKYKGKDEWGTPFFTYD